MQKVFWEVQLLAPPTVIRHCKKCNRKSEFFSSGQFRVNAQQKALDVWLIYKCSVCNSTWNMAVCSRMHPKKIGDKLLQQFSQNNPRLAEEVSMNMELLRRNGVELGQPPYSIIGQDIYPNQPFELHIFSKYPLSISPAAILRKKMKLSRKQLDALLNSEWIMNPSGLDIRKCKLGRELVLQIGTKHAD